MIKAVTFINRKQGLSVENFQQYWIHNHAEIISRLPGVRRYVQNHLLPDNYLGQVPVCDGIAELWAENSQSFRTISSSIAYTKVQEDEQHFLDRQKLQMVLTEEKTLKDGRITPGLIKCISLLHCRKGLDIGEFLEYWSLISGPETLQLPGLIRYVQSSPVAGAYRSGRIPPCDGIASMWFNSRDDINKALNTGLYSDIVEAEKNFIDPFRKQSFITTEHIIIQ